MTSRKTKYSTYLLLLLPFAEEFWHVMSYGRYKDMIVNWWVALDYPYSIQWYLHDAGIYLSNVLQAIVIFRLTVKISLLHNVARILLIYRLIQLALYVSCFDWFPVAVVFTILFLVAAFYFVKSHKDNSLTTINYKPQ